MYKILRPLLFSIDPERIHHLVFSCLRFATQVPAFKSALQSLYAVGDPQAEKTLFGLRFKNPVGLAAGFDKDAKLVDELELLGFGFIEIGTLTPQPQPGNFKPRLFRLPKDQALINRMGFNNDGVLAAAECLRKRTGKIIVGGNIGKNKNTPNDLAHQDYTFCFEALYDHVDYFVVNVSSPNTPGLRELQEKEPLQRLLKTVKDLSRSKPILKPVLLKIAPDLTNGQLDDIVEILVNTGMDGVIATNTTIVRDGLHTHAGKLEAIGAGGLSGKPLARRSTEVIRYLRQKLGKDFPIIGVGGIMTPADALEKLEAGADLLQLYTGFIYEGPGLVKRINESIANARDYSRSK
jgi:dihydroorotate dehydrogenase